MHAGVIRRLLLLPLVGWPLLGAGQLPEDPTRPPATPTSIVVAAPVVHCVEAAIVAADRRVAVVDGVRVREGDDLGFAVVREISATGIAVEKDGLLHHYAMGNCSPRQSRE